MREAVMRNFERLFTFSPEPRKAKIERYSCGFFPVREMLGGRKYISEEQNKILDRIFILYRALCVCCYNFIQSGHPGGSISAGRQFIGAFLGGGMAYDLSEPQRRDQDIPVLAAGHKSFGWYVFISLLYEAVFAGKYSLLSGGEKYLRFEDLLGIRKNEAVPTPLMSKFSSRALDGHPVPPTPFVFLATGASGAGISSSVGLAVAARDAFRDDPPDIYAFEGEGGLTSGRVEEAMQIASRSMLHNYFMIIDHNDASIDVPNVCTGGYCATLPEERGIIHGFDAIVVEGGNDFNEIIAGYDIMCRELKNSKRPKMLVVRTEKGEGYGFGTNRSHGAGWKTDDPGYFAAQRIFEDTFNVKIIPRDEIKGENAHEDAFLQNLLLFRNVMENDAEMRELICGETIKAKERLGARNTERTYTSPVDISAVFENPDITVFTPPVELDLKPGDKMALRDALSMSLGELNKVSGGGFFFSAADLFGSLSLNKAVPFGICDENDLDARVIAGGIAEDALTGVMCGISAYGKHIGVVGSYAAFLSSMGWTSVRLNAIAHDVLCGKNINPVILIMGHAGPKTGEDGPTHACPQSLSAWGSFPKGSVITLTPWDNREVWPLLLAALRKKPAAVAFYVTRPQETVADREHLGLADTDCCIQGLYEIKIPDPGKKCDGYVIIQGSAVMLEVIKVIREIEDEGCNIGYCYVTSKELFDLLPDEKQKSIWGKNKAMSSMAITDFTSDVTDKWIMSEKGRRYSMHPFSKGHFLGSGKGEDVLKQAGIDSLSIKERILDFARRS
jgi:transketolase